MLLLQEPTMGVLLESCQKIQGDFLPCDCLGVYLTMGPYAGEPDVGDAAAAGDARSASAVCIARQPLCFKGVHATSISC